MGFCKSIWHSVFSLKYTHSLVAEREHFDKVVLVILNYKFLERDIKDYLNSGASS